MEGCSCVFRTPIFGFASIHWFFSGVWCVGAALGQAGYDGAIYSSSPTFSGNMICYDYHGNSIVLNSLLFCCARLRLPIKTCIFAAKVHLKSFFTGRAGFPLTEHSWLGFIKSGAVQHLVVGGDGSLSLRHISSGCLTVLTAYPIPGDVAYLRLSFPVPYQTGT